MKTSLKATLFITIGVTLIALVAVLSAGWTPKLGLDLAGGFQATLKPEHKVTSGELNTVINIIQERIDGLGVSSATTNSQGGDVIVQVPGLSNRNQLLSTIESTAEMLFRPVLCLAPAADKGGKTVSPGALPTTCPSANLQNATNLNVDTSTGEAQGSPAAWSELAKYATTSAAQDDPTKTVLLNTSSSSGYNGERMLLGPAQVLGKQISSASAVFNTPDWDVELNFNGSGSTDWDNLARSQFHALIAIDLDGSVISAPLTQPSQSSFTSFDGKVQISGSFTESTAKNLALQLQYGALPVGLKLLYNQVVSPTLGRSSLTAGLAAGIGGLILVLIYTIFYYRALGIVVVSGLAVTAALLWAIVSAFSHSGLDLTLDLSGVTGLIVSVGITVDSYIVYFERLKDEARAGRSIRSTVDRAFQGAFRTVLAADFVSFIAALILYIFSVSTVRGFAFFLGLSTLLDVFTTFFFTRPLVIWLGRSKTVTEAKYIGVARGLAVPTAESAS